DGDSIRRQEANIARWLERHPGVKHVETYRDEGKSGFTGKHREKGDFARFQHQLDRGGIPRDSYLLVEALDRLSRQEPMEGVMLVGQLIKAGIRVVVFNPSEQVYDADRLRKEAIPALLSMVVGFAVGHEESAKKAIRNGEVYQEKLEKARRREPLFN